MGILNLFGVCLAVFSVSALAADPPVPRGNVSANLNPTTGYYSSTNSTVRLPNGVSASPTVGGLPVVSKYSGGLQQQIPTGITIDAIKKSVPLPAVVRSSTQSLKTAATRCLTSARCNVALLLAGAGIDKLLDDLDWIMGEGGKPSHITRPPASEFTPCSASSVCYTSGQSNRPPTSNILATCVYYLEKGFIISSAEDSNGSPRCGYARRTEPDYIYWDGNRSGYVRTQNGQAPVVLSDVSDSDISTGVDSNYTPEPTDWPALTPELELDDVEITSAPTLQGEPKTTTVYDADGNPHKITETNIWYDFTPKDNPSSQPALDMKMREETKTYENGALTGTIVTESSSSAGSAGSGGGGSPPSDLDIPTDCEFMPTVCAFLDWVKNDDTPEEPDLSALIDNRDFTETYLITGGSKQCPADYEFTVDFIGRTYGLSFEPACDFASKMYYFVMAAAYIFAAYITIGASRNG